MKASSTTFLLASLVGLSLTACLPLDDILGGSSVSGTVQGQNFMFTSGTADSDARGNYFITLSDSSRYDCFSTPAGSYLTIVIAAVTGPGDYRASEAVTFNSIKNNVNMSEVATSGTVTIESLDEVAGEITGRLSANSADSAVDGSFRVEICD